MYSCRPVHSSAPLPLLLPLILDERAGITAANINTTQWIYWQRMLKSSCQRPCMHAHTRAVFGLLCHHWLRTWYQSLIPRAGTREGSVMSGSLQDSPGDLTQNLLRMVYSILIRESSVPDAKGKENTSKRQKEGVYSAKESWWLCL